MKVIKILFIMLEFAAAICLIVKVSLMITTNMPPLQIFAVINMLAGVIGLMFDIGFRINKALTWH